MKTFYGTCIIIIVLLNIFTSIFATPDVFQVIVGNVDYFEYIMTAAPSGHKKLTLFEFYNCKFNLAYLRIPPPTTDVNQYETFISLQKNYCDGLYKTWPEYKLEHYTKKIVNEMKDFNGKLNNNTKSALNQCMSVKFVQGKTSNDDKQLIEDDVKKCLNEAINEIEVKNLYLNIAKLKYICDYILQVEYLETSFTGEEPTDSNFSVDYNALTIVEMAVQVNDDGQIPQSSLDKIKSFLETKSVETSPSDRLLCSSTLTGLTKVEYKTIQYQYKFFPTSDSSSGIKKYIFMIKETIYTLTPFLKIFEKNLGTKKRNDYESFNYKMLPESNIRQLLDTPVKPVKHEPFISYMLRARLQGNVTPLDENLWKADYNSRYTMIK